MMESIIYLDILFNGIIIFVGNYGSGKTEVSVNFAVNQKLAGNKVCIADLDLVNPYFRTREARVALEKLGIEVILPPQQYMHADLPILTPAVAGAIRKPDCLTLLDAGGDDVGATVLAALADALKGETPEVFQVVNPFRPYTDTIEGCLNIRDEIESASNLSVTGIVGNANLIDDTTADHIYRGYDFVMELEEKSGLPLQFITLMEGSVPGIDSGRFSCPVLKMSRQLVPPWRKAGRLGLP